VLLYEKQKNVNFRLFTKQKEESFLLKRTIKKKYTLQMNNNNENSQCFEFKLLNRVVFDAVAFSYF
jgi:hypothetical protein